MDAALNDDLCIRNYAAKTKKPKYEPVEKRPLSEKEIDQLLSADLSEQERLFVCLGLFQGFRKSESLGSHRVTGDRIEVSAVWESVGNKASIKPVPKTEAGFREMSIMPQTKDAIKRIQDSHNRMYLFSNDDGTLITPEQYKGLWRRIQTAFNVAAGGEAALGLHKAKIVTRKITSHYLRHTFCTLLYYAGFDILQTQYLMGQDDVKTTLETYTHLDKESLGKRDKYAKWKPILRQVFLGEKASKRRQNDNL